MIFSLWIFCLKPETNFLRCSSKKSRCGLKSENPKCTGVPASKFTQPSLIIGRLSLWKGTGDYKLPLAGSRFYVNGIIKGNAGICPLVDIQSISGAEDSPGKLHGKGHKVMELTLSRLTSALQIAFFNSITGINEQ